MTINKLTQTFRLPVFTILALIMVLTLITAQSPLSVMAEEPSEYYDHFIAYKYASQEALGPDGTLTYTILLYNSSTETVTAEIVDMLPAELAYVDKSATEGGVYDVDTHTVTWTGVEVPFASQVKVSFDVTPAVEVVEPTIVTNEATVTTSDNEYVTSFDIVLLPDIPVEDVEFPVVESVVIDEADALTTRDVTLHIQATDNVGVERMLIKEYQIIEKPNPAKQGWDVTESSNWVPYEEEYEWTLGELPGVHFIGVWVADAAGNISHATMYSFDFASYLAPESSFIGKITFVPYAVYYEADVDVEVVLSQLTPNDPDNDEDGMLMLYIFHPGEFDEPVVVPVIDADTPAIHLFTTPDAGVYTFLVGVMAPDTGVSYNLSITPGGGPLAWGPMPELATTGNGVASANESSAFGFDEVGLDPISMALANQPAVVEFRISLPMVVR